MTDWRRVWELVEARALDLRWTMKELQDRTGISEATYRAMRTDGRAIKSPVKYRAMCDALGWSEDSVERILAGGRPEVVANATPLRSRHELPTALDRTELRELLERVAALEDEIARLREPPAGGAPPGPTARESPPTKRQPRPR